jgi:hypothetical protein
LRYLRGYALVNARQRELKTFGLRGIFENPLAFQNPLLSLFFTSPSLI